MKKTLAILLAVCLCVSVFSSVMLTSADVAPITTYSVDLTQNPSNCLFAYDTCTATVNNNNLVIAVNNSKTINGNTATSWLSNYSLLDNGSAIELKGNDKVLVKIVYKVTEVTSKVTIGVGGWSSIKNSPVVVMSKVDHTTASPTKENTFFAEFSNVQVSGQYMSKIKLIFNGTGKFEISKVEAQVINSASVSECSLATLYDGANVVGKEYVLNGNNVTTTLPEKDGYKFTGWYNAKGESAGQVTAATSFYAGWDKPATVTYTDLNDVDHLFKTTEASLSAGTTAVYNDGALNVHIRHDTDLKNNWAQNWYTNYATLSDKVVSPSKVTVTVNYKVLSVDSDTYGAQIGVGASDAVNNTVYPMSFKKHTSADEGKSFTYNFTYTVNGGTYGVPKVDFAGAGDFEINSIILTVAEPGNYVGIDLTKSEKINGNKATMTLSPATQTEDMSVSVETYAYKLVENDGTVNYHPSQHWYGGGMVALKYANTSYVTFASNTKYAINVKYDVTRIGTQDENFAPQIGILYNKNSNTIGDNDEWILSANKNTKCGSYELSAIVTENLNTYPLRLVFAGVGSFKIKEVTIKPVSSNTDAQKVIKYVDTMNKSDFAEVATTGSALNTLNRTAGYNFGGWLKDGVKVTTVTEDGTLVAKWFVRTDLNTDEIINVLDLISLKKALSASASDLFFDVDRDNRVDATDVVTITNVLLGITANTINGNGIDGYSVYASNKSLMVKKAAEEITYGVKSAAGVSLPIVYEETDKEIAIVVDETVGIDNYTVAIDGAKLIITAGSDYAASTAARKVSEYFRTNGMIPAGFTLSGEYDANYSMVGNYKYAWGDEFNGNSLDTDVWMTLPEKSNDYTRTAPAGRGTIDYTNPDYTVNDGVLTLNTKSTSTGYQATKITAKDQFTYGIMETKVLFGSGNGGCYQVWARGKDITPQETCLVNEFDFIENFGTSVGHPNLHTWRQYTDHTNHGSLGQITTRNDVDNITDGEYHYISMEWTANKVRFYFDGNLYLEQNIENQEVWDAFRNSTHMTFAIDVLSAANASYGTIPAAGNFSDSMSVDFVRVYQLGSDNHSITK